jgi:hypothetical protein
MFFNQFFLKLSQSNSEFETFQKNLTYNNPCQFIEDATTKNQCSSIGKNLIGQVN